MGRTKKARRDFGEALGNDPGFEEAIRILATLRSKPGT